MAKPLNGSWTKNAKLAKTSGGKYNVIGFGTLADFNFTDEKGVKRNTCEGALACKGVCYAKQGAYVWDSVVKARKRNLKLTMRKDFAALIVADLERMRTVNTVRIHDAGDFYSQDYLDKWVAVARALPNLRFYTYTKSLNLDFSKVPANFHVTQSIGGKYDASIDPDFSHSRIFATHEDRERAGYIDGNVDDVPAIRNLVQIGLVYHGNKNLTLSQKKYFS